VHGALIEHAAANPHAVADLGIDHRVYGMIAAAPPPAAVIEGMERTGKIQKGVLRAQAGSAGSFEV
jgi:hypothetical protein